MNATGGAGSSEVIIRCSLCGKVYRVHRDRLPGGVSSFPCRKCGSLLSIHDLTTPDEGKKGDATGARTVLISVDEKELADLVQRILQKRPYRVLTAPTGAQTLEIIRREAVDLLLINVFLPDMMVFEVLDEVNEEKDRKGIPSILLSSVHHGARYKRAPTSLYGADDYIERHHLPDLLVPKIERLLDRGEEEPSRISPDEMPPLSDDQVLQRRELEEIESASGTADDITDPGIRRTCRVIVSDIALYNEDLISSARPDGIIEAIAEDLKEGETLLVKRYPDMGEKASELLREEIVSLLQSRGIQIP